MTRPEYVSCVDCGEPVKVGRRGRLPTRCRPTEIRERRSKPTETTCDHCEATCVPSRNRMYSHCDECVASRKAERDTWLRKRYGVTLKQLDVMFEKQGGRCAICRSELRWGAATARGRGLACIDHDHETGKIRGVLCHHCNRALGAFNDNLEGVMRVVAYLKGVDTIRVGQDGVERYNMG